MQLTEARAQDVTQTLLPSAALEGAADLTWGASLELQLRCLRRMQPGNFKSMAAFSRWQVRRAGPSSRTDQGCECLLWAVPFFRAAGSVAGSSKLPPLVREHTCVHANVPHGLRWVS